MCQSIVVVPIIAHHRRGSTLVSTTRANLHIRQRRLTLSLVQQWSWERPSDHDAAWFFLLNFFRLVGGPPWCPPLQWYMARDNIVWFLQPFVL